MLIVLSGANFIDFINVINIRKKERKKERKRAVENEEWQTSETEKLMEGWKRRNSVFVSLRYNC